MNEFLKNTPVADRIRHLTSNQINAGSNPARGAKTKIERKNHDFQCTYFDPTKGHENP